MSRTAPDAGLAYPSPSRWLVFLTLLVNLAMVSRHLWSVISAIDPHHQYRTRKGHLVSGSNLIAQELFFYSIPIAGLLVLMFMLWRDREREASIIYLVCALLAVPIVGAQYLGQEAAGYVVSSTSYWLMAGWFLLCAVIAGFFAWRVTQFEEDQRSALISATLRSR